MLTYWALLGAFIAMGSGRASFKRWLQPSTGGVGWRLLPCLTFALFLPTFLLNWSGLNQGWIVAIWLGLAIIDPWLQEGYWRGVLRMRLPSWPAGLSIGYAVLFFAPSHYLR